MRTVEHDVERILRRWFEGVYPGTVLRQVLDKLGIKIFRVPLSKGLSNNSADLRTIYLHDNIQERLTRRTEHLEYLENRLLCEEWVRMRIKQRTRREPTPEEEDFVALWVEEWFLPIEKFEVREEYLKIQDWSLHGMNVGPADIWTLVLSLAEDFHCTPTYVRTKLYERGFLEPDELRVRFQRPDNVIDLRTLSG